MITETIADYRGLIVVFMFGLALGWYALRKMERKKEQVGGGQG